MLSTSTFSRLGASSAPPCSSSCSGPGCRMIGINEGELLWTPSPSRVERAQLTHYLGWLKERGRRFDSYAALWQWSIDDLEGFWGSLWEYFDILASQPYECVLKVSSMPGAQWFP